MKLTKLLTGLGAAVLTAALALTVSAADPVVVWDFANADDTTLYNEDGTVAFSTNGVTATYDAENACLTADVLNGDPYLQLPSRGDFPAENRFVRVKYYQSGISDWSTSIYFTTDTVAWSETGHWKGIYDGDDDVWCEQTFYMDECPAWAGTITGMRLDVFDNAYEGQLAKVAYVAVFGSEEDANNFDYAAWRAAGGATTNVVAEAPAAEESAAPGIGEAYPVSGTDVPADSVLIRGTLIGNETGWGDAAAAGRHAAFDGNVETFFDPLGVGDGYTGVDAGEEMIITKIMIHPRTTYPDRFDGATIEASNDPDFNESVEIFYNANGAAAEIAFIDCTADIDASVNTGYRYFRYINYMQHGDVAEVELYGKAVDGSNPDYSAAAAPAASAGAEYITLTVVDDGDVIDDDTTQDLGGSGQPIQILADYGCGYSSLGDMVVFNDVDFGANGAASAKMHFGYGANDGSTTTLAFYIDDPEGTPAYEAEVGFTGGWTIAESGWVDLGLAVPAGTHTIYVKFTNEKSGSISELSFIEAPAAEEAPAEEPAAEEAASTTVEANLFSTATVVEVSGLEVEGSNTGDMAIDGDLATRWSSNVDDAAHIIVDLGAVTPVDSLDIYWETACAADYTVEVSEDNSNWTVVATVTDNATGASPVGDAVSHSWDAINARYIKINCTRRNTEWGNSIWEMVAYACEAPVVEEVVEEEVVAEEPVVVEEEVVEEAPVEEAAETFDFAVIAAIATAVSAAGYAISKKR